MSCTHLPLLMIDHNVMRLYVPMHDSLAVAVVERLEQLEDVVPYVKVGELGVQAAEVGIVDVLEYQRRRLTLSCPLISVQNNRRVGKRGMYPIASPVGITNLIVAHDVEQLHDIGST
jgi:hypothetical protein